MELKIKPSAKNKFPLTGFLLKGITVRDWLVQLQLIGFQLNQIKVYPIPGTSANSIWGCLVISSIKIASLKIQRHEFCQQVFPNVFIPENSDLSPKISIEDHSKLFSENIHVFHPEFGCAELTNEFDLSTLLKIPKEKFQFVFKPESAMVVASRVHSFRIAAKPEEDIIKELDIKKEDSPDKPLNPVEKGKLGLLRNLFKPSGNKDASSYKPNGLMNAIGMGAGLLGSLVGKKSNWKNQVQENYENLEERNKNEIDKLMDLLKKNPADALKYAIPLDENNSSRGGLGGGSFALGSIWRNFSLFGSDSRYAGGAGGGGSIDIGNKYFELNQQYRETAKKLIAQKDYKKAAFVYLKLLKDYQAAAQTLEEGRLFQEAAIVYLKQCNNKAKAAECYEKGKMYAEAIDLQIELENYEIVGDLYAKINKRAKALEFYQTAIDKETAQLKYISASIICRNKMNDPENTQKLLLTGWHESSQKADCLNLYFDNLTDNKFLIREVDRIHSETKRSSNKNTFLNVVYKQFRKSNENEDYLREIGYQLISDLSFNNKGVLDKLRLFNPNDREVQKDTARFVSKKRKRQSKG